jgi:RNA polymerase sigma-70 factor, ECF subfamily
MNEFRPDLRVRDERQGGVALPTDEDLIERVARGQNHAFDLLVARHGARLHGFLRHILEDDFAAEDVAQEVLVKVLLKARDRDPGSRFAVWLFCVARNEAYDYLRRRRTRSKVVAALSALGSGMRSLFHGASPSAGLEADEFRRDFELALTELPPEQREVFLLREREGLEYDEIATVVGIPAKTVSTRLFRAREKLRNSLRHHLNGESDLDELEAASNAGAEEDPR